MRLTSPKHSVVSRMFVYTALSLGLVNFLCVLCQTPLDCPTDGSEITISDIGMTPQSFSFPPPLGSNAFPQNFECNWKIRTQSGLALILRILAINTGNNDVIEVIGSDGVTKIETINGPQTGLGGSFLVDSVGTMTVRLTTDSDTAAQENFQITVVGAKTSDIDECAMTPSPCHSNASCVNTKESFQCICEPGFTGNGFECQEEPIQQPMRRFLLPILASSLGTGLTGVGLLLALFFAANSSLLPTVWAP